MPVFTLRGPWTAAIYNTTKEAEVVVEWSKEDPRMKVTILGVTRIYPYEKTKQAFLRLMGRICNRWKPLAPIGEYHILGYVGGPMRAQRFWDSSEIQKLVASVACGEYLISNSNTNYQETTGELHR